MSVLAYIYTGIGSQYVGIGKEVYDKTWGMRQFFDKMQKKKPDFKVNKFAFLGPIEELLKEENGLPIMYTYQTGIYEVLKQNRVTPEQMSGYKSGQLAGLVSSGGAFYEDILEIIFKKEELLKQEITAGNFTHLLITGILTGQVEQVAAEINKTMKTEVCAYLTQETSVVICEKAAKDKVIEIFKKLKADAVITELPNEEISNFSLLEGIAQKLIPEFKNLKMDKPIHRIVSQTTGNYYDSVAEIRESFMDYLTRPARLDIAFTTMMKNGVNTFVELGCGNMLGRAIKKIDSGKRILSTHDIKSLSLVVKLAN